MRYRATIRGDKAELRGYFTTPTPEVIPALAEALTPLGMLIVSPAADDYNPFRSGVTDSQVELVGEMLYGVSWGTDMADPDLIRRALEAVHSPHLEYYDPARQDRISEHDCTFEDGQWWFGHGMPCKHPELHYGNEPSMLDAPREEKCFICGNTPDGCYCGSRGQS